MQRDLYVALTTRDCDQTEERANNGSRSVFGYASRLVLRASCKSSRIRRACVLLCAVTLLVPASAAGASVASDQAQVQALQHKIAAEGEHIQSLVARSNAAQARASELDAQVAGQQKILDADRAAEANAALAVQHLAVSAYMRSGTIDTAALDLFRESNDTTRVLAHNTYAGIVGGKLSDAIANFHLARAKAEDAQKTLRSEQAQANETLRQVNAARKKAEGAIADEQATLSHAQADLFVALAAQRRASQAAAEQQLASNVSPPSSTPSPPPPPPVLPPPTNTPPGSYANPLRAISGLTPERIDQGVDFSGFGPIYAVGNGVVLSTTNSGWPGGTFIAYRLTDGPAAGLVVFSAEDINPSVQVGSTVSANTVIGQMYEGPNGIEMGWANPSGDGDTMARTYNEYAGGNSTAFGYNFSQFLQSIGAPGGILQSTPGPLPIPWPQW